MPEAPELNGLVNFLAERCFGHRIAEVQVGAISVVKTPVPPISILIDSEIIRVERIGKYLLFGLQTPDPLSMAIHLSRAGWVRWYDQTPKTRLKLGRGPIALRLSLVDEQGELVGGFDLTEAGTQKRLAVYLANDPSEIPGISRLGPDVLGSDFTEENLAKIIASARGQHLKTLLRDQTSLAGIGNAYSDEILHSAKLSPKMAASALTQTQRKDLFDAINQTLGEATKRALAVSDIAHLKDGKRKGMNVHGRAGKSCPVCGETILQIASGDSTYEYCPKCQTKGKALADHRRSRFLK